MSGFEADWLALREPADVAFRAPAVLDAAAQHVASAAHAPLKICDLGSGTGAAVSAFSHLFVTPQHWCLVDQDAANLDRAVARYADVQAFDEVNVVAKIHDLVADPAPWSAETDLVTATALFDLTSEQWLSEFVDRLTEDELPLLTTMTYDGRHVFSSSLPFDVEMKAAFNAHQHGDKGFGPATGPDAIGTLTALLVDRGYEVVAGESSWRLDPVKHDALISALLDGWAEAVISADMLPEGKVRDWRSARRKSPGELRVGHTDIFAAPST